jgi:hypothetical protein
MPSSNNLRSKRPSLDLAARINWRPVVAVNIKSRTLTPYQRDALGEYRREWRETVLSTKRPVKALVEQGISRTYKMVGLRAPTHFLWFASPVEAAITATFLSFPHTRLGIPEHLRARCHSVRQEVLGTLGTRTWSAARKMVGAYARKDESDVENVAQLGMTGLASSAGLERRLPPGINPTNVDCAEVESLALDINQFAFRFVRVLASLLAKDIGPGTPGHPSLSLLYGGFNLYPRGFLARHDFLSREVGDVESERYAGLIVMARNCSFWWPVFRCAILAEFPKQLSLDSNGLPHNDCGPAVAYRNGLKIYARHGSWTAPPRT